MSTGDFGAIERLLIEAECSRLVTSYAFLVDRRRYAELVDLFTHDADFERPGVKVNGQDAIRSFMEARSVAIATRHVCAPSFFEKVELDEAVSITYLTMFMGEGTDTGPNDVPGIAGLAEFHDLFRRTAEGWRIASHVARPVMVVKSL